MTVTRMTYDEFVTYFHGNVGWYTSAYSQRHGQALFNLLVQHHPRVAEAIRGTPVDPFHRDEVSDETWTTIHENW